MKREDIIRMRREADKFADEVCFSEIERTCENMELVSDERFAKLVQWYTLGQNLVGLIDFHVAEEREACVKLCRGAALSYYDFFPEAAGACIHLTTAIKERGNA